MVYAIGYMDVYVSVDILSNPASGVVTQRTRYPLIKEYTLKL